jgi:eukaryotic-like serine/threonine-protein kinase
MGVVYKAHDTKLDRTVALKFLPSHTTSSDEAKERFTREAKTAAALNHPNICTIYNVDEHDGQQFISMEYVDGSTLREKLQTKNIKLETIINYAHQIAEALSEAHEKGIVHRDIKPENIMVDSKNRIKVMDFGLAKIKGSMNLTRSGSTVGTARYMSPEQIQGGELDARSDIWSFGVVLYEMLTGQSPFHGEYEPALLYQILNESPPPISRYRDDVSEGLEQCILRMLEKEPDARYDSFLSVIHDLRKSIGGEVSYRKPEPKPDQNGLSVAVIDFQNITGNDADAWLAGGIAETVTVDLSKISSLRVVSREKVLKTLAQYSDEKLNDRQVIDIGQKLKVRWMVWGAYQKMGSKIRITAHFTDVPSGDLIHSTKVDGAMDDIFELQDNIIINLKDTLNLKVKSDELKVIKLPQTNKITAYEFYAKGRQLFYRFDPESLTDARRYFQKAIDADPNYALAYSGLGATFIFHYIATTNPADLDTGIDLFNKALDLDNKLAESHHWLAYAYSRKSLADKGIYHGLKAIELDPDNYYGHYFLAANYLYRAVVQYEFEDLNKAARHFKESLTIEPSYQWSYLFVGWFLMMFGMYDKALEQFDRARELDVAGSFQGPRCIFFYPLIGFAYCFRGEVDQGIISFHDSIEILTSLEHVYKIPMLALSYSGLGYACYLRKDFSESITYYTQAVDLINDNPNSLGTGYHMIRAKTGLAKTFYQIGMKNEADKYFKEALSLFNTKERFNFNISCFDIDASLAIELAGFYAITRDAANSIEMIGKAIGYGWRDYKLLENDDSFRNLRKKEEFQKIVNALQSEPLIPELAGNLK